MKVRPGNKLNSFLNGEWAKHVRGFGKRLTSKRRRQIYKNELEILKKSLPDKE